MSLADFVDRPLSVASGLDRGELGGSYLEACILISGVISAVASCVWPGDRGDRRRFIETWIRFSDLASGATKLSVPLLVTHLRTQGRSPEADALTRSRARMFGPGYDSRVLSGDEVDADEAQVSRECPTLDRRTLREHSYAALFYAQVRCKLVHEYEMGGKASPWPMTMRETDISYVNRSVAPPDVALPAVHHERRIHFHVPWLLALSKRLAVNADAALVNGPIRKPSSWWIDEK
jgi:hypothetical protein